MDHSLFVYYLWGIASVAAFPLLVFCALRHRKLPETRFFVRLVGAVSILSLYMPLAQYLKIRSLHFYVDFSHWLQLLRTIVATGKPFCLNQDFLWPGTLNYFSVHFTPFVYALALPLRFFPFPGTLVFLNYVLMISSVIPLYKLARHSSKDDLLGFLMVFLLLWYPTFQYIVLYEFDMLRFSIPVILWMIYFYEKKNLFLYLLFALAAVLVREEVGLTLMMFGAYLVFFARRFWLGAITACLGLGAFLLLTQGVMPALGTPGVHNELITTTLFQRFGANFNELFFNLVRHPVTILKQSLNLIKLANLGMYFLPLLFIPLLAPAVLVSILGNIGIVTLSISDTHSSYMLYYLSPSLPFIFYAFIKGWPKFLKVLDRFPGGPCAQVDKTALSMLFTGMMVANVFFGPSPVSMQFWSKNIRPAPFKTQDFHFSVYEITPHSRDADRISSLIPGDAIVSAQHFLSTTLYKKRGVMVFPQTESRDGRIKADYIFFDTTNNGLKEESPAYRKQSDFSAIQDDDWNWQLVASIDGFFLYKRRGD